MRRCRSTRSIARCALGVATLVALAGSALSGCEPIRQTHGYVPADAYIARLEVGSDSRADVVEKIGRPSTTATFEDDEWFYISRTTETRAFFAPSAVNQNVLVVAFDAEGVVSEVERYGLEDGRIVNLVSRTTPTRGKRLTFLQQLLGNLGRVTPGQITGQDSGL